MTRLTPEGTPKGGWYPQNRISVEAALRHYTRDGAYANFDEQERGTLTPGKFADLVVLSKDILTIPPMDIQYIPPALLERIPGELCKVAPKASYKVVAGVDHSGTINATLRDQLAWMADRFAGRPAERACPIK